MSRYFALVLPVCFAVLSGCAPSKGDIEKSIKDEMKTSMNVEITSTNLTKGADGGYTGTATAANGDVYDVTAETPKGGRSAWTAIPAQSTVERMVREKIENDNKVKVKSIALTKQGPGVFSGTLELEGGGKMKVSTSMEGKNMNWKAEPMQ